jgi:Zn-dependent protease
VDISPEQVKGAVLALIAFIVSVSVHEFGHAWMATRMGDGIPRAQGRLTLSPLAHIDLVGTIILPLVAALAPGGYPLVAWGKPVQTNPANYDVRRISRRTGHLLVSLMGPAMNLVLAAVVSVLFLAMARAGLLSRTLAEGIIFYLVALNLRLLAFNLLPVPPLDGGSIVEWALPDRLQFIAQALRRYGMLLLFILIMTPGVMTFLMRPATLLTRAWATALLRLVPA